MNEQYYIAKRLEVVGNNTTYIIPIFFHREDDQGILHMIPIVHGTIYREACRLAKKDYELQQKRLQDKCTLCNTLDGPYTPRHLFASNNYINLSNILKDYFEVSDILETYRTLGILLDGEPGLGKTYFVDFLASQKICGEVLKIDMTTVLERDFTSIIKSINTGKRDTSFTVMIDELDKYLDYRIRDAYKKEQDNSNITRANKNASQVTSIVCTFESFQCNFKRNFLFQLLSFIESNHHTYGMVIIFCSNNFETIFENIDNTHYESLKERFVKITFNRCVCEELKRFITYINDKFINNIRHINAEELNNMLVNIRTDISVPYRTIEHLFIKSGYDIRKFINSINMLNDTQNIPDICDDHFYTKQLYDNDDNDDNNDDGDNDYTELYNF
jgi:hypothetical protein